MRQVIVFGSFDDLRSRHMRVLQEAKKLGELHVLLVSDEGILATEGSDPRFSQEERQYFVESIRYVDRVSLVDATTRDSLPLEHVVPGTIWVQEEILANAAQESFCQEQGMEYRVVSEQQLEGYPEPADASDPQEASPHKKVLVTGCYDWFHSGHVRFFEEVSELGDLYVVVGHDANIALLKGEGHPMYTEDQRRFMAGSIRFVKRALVSSGEGWLDARPEIERIKPDIYAVNEDGDRPEKRDYCETHGIEYRVLKRLPKEGLPKRESTALRGF